MPLKQMFYVSNGRCYLEKIKDEKEEKPNLKRDVCWLNMNFCVCDGKCCLETRCACCGFGIFLLVGFVMNNLLFCTCGTTGAF